MGDISLAFLNRQGSDYYQDLASRDLHKGLYKGLYKGSLIQRFKMRFISSLLKCLMVVVVLFGVSASEASAKTKAHANKEASKKSEASSDVATSKSGWQVRMSRDEKGVFGYCVMSANFSNDLSLAIALSPKQEINIGIGVPNAGFAKDEKHPMNVSIDKAYSKDGVAIAANPELLLIPMRQDKELYAALRTGKAITLAGKEDATKFALKNTGKALEGLQTCVDVGTGKTKMPPEAAAKTGAKNAATGKQPKAGQFPPSLKGLLVKAGLKDLQLVNIPDPSKAPVDFGWKTGGLFGGMRERPVPAEATIEKMTDVMEAGYKKQCSGKFNITKGAVENYSGVSIRTMGVGCEMKEQKVYVSLLIYLTDNHLFTMFMHESDSYNTAEANKARDSIAVLIRQLAKEQPAEKPAATKPAEKSDAVPAAEPAAAAAPTAAEPAADKSKVDAPQQ